MSNLRESREPSVVKHRPVAASRALVVTFGSVLHPRGGMQVRARSTIEILAGLGLRIAVISHSEPEEPLPASIDALHVLRRPLSLGWSRELARAIRHQSRAADFIVVESALLLPAVRAGRPNVPIIWDTNECETLHYSRLPASFGNRLRRFVWKRIERWAVEKSDVIIAISETEARFWRQLFPKAEKKLTVVEHRSLRQPVSQADARSRLERLCKREFRGPVLLFVGNLLAKHNAVAAEWLLGVLAPALPAKCSMILAGPGTESLSGTHRALSNSVLLGSVDDIDMVIAGSDVCLAPLAAGAGVKTKILDYLAHGKPVIATPVALEGLEGAPGVHTGELRDFPAVVIDQLRRPEPVDANAREELQRRWIMDRHGPNVVSKQWQATLGRLTSGTVSPAGALASPEPPKARGPIRGLRKEFSNWHLPKPLAGLFFRHAFHRGEVSRSSPGDRSR